MDTQNLITEIERFAAENEIAPATVTSRAVGNSRLYARIKTGGSCTLRIAERLQKYMAGEGPRSSSAVVSRSA